MKIKIIPHNIELEASSDKSVMEIAHENGVYIKSICNGQANCAECRVKVKEGEDNVSLPSRKEMDQIGTGYFIDQRRLSCQMYCYGDVVLDLSEQMEKESTSAGFVVDDLKEEGIGKGTSHAVKARIIDQEDTEEDLD